MPKRLPIRVLMVFFATDPAIFIVKTEEGMTWKRKLSAIKAMIDVRVEKKIRWDDIYIDGVTCAPDETEEQAWSKMVATYNPKREMIEVYQKKPFMVVPYDGPVSVAHA